MLSQPEYGPGLGSSGNLDFFLTFQGRDIDLGSQDGLGNPEWHLAIDVVALPLKERVVFHEDHDVEIPVRSSLGARLSFALDSQLRAAVHARRNLDLKDLFLPYASTTLAGLARVANDLAAALALTAGAADRKEALLIADLTASVTSLANDRMFSLGRPPALAARTSILSRDLDLGPQSKSRLTKRNLQVVAQIRAPFGPPAPPGPEDVAEAKELA